MSIAAPPTDAETISSPAPLPADWPGEDAQLRAWGREMDWLDAQWSAHAFAEYAYEYIITAEHVLLAHNRSMEMAYREAEKKADELGVPHWKLVNYYCDGY